MQDLLSVTYGDGYINKTDAPILSSTTGVFNAVFGAMAFNQINMEANAWAVLPKYPWQHSGFRAITADSTGNTSGIAENAAISDSEKPTFAEITVPPKEVDTVFEVSMRQVALVAHGDDAIGDLEMLRPYFASRHAKKINVQLLTDGDTLASAMFESIDRVTASSAYATAIGWTAADEDIYGIDRSGASWADAIVSHNGGTDRSLTLLLIEQLLASIEVAGGRTNVFLTGADTKWAIIGLAQTNVRYNGTVKLDQMARVGINGVETEEGIGYGRRVATVYGIPLFSSQSVAKDTISRLYALDTTMQEGTNIPRLGIALLYPTLYFESGPGTTLNNPFITGKYNNEALYYTSGELVCTFFKAQGSLRDLKLPA